ncbi:hypothetical protein K6U26_12800 [Vibrio parahaemolyticus]|nr:hypothetical protein [Vibrio parahaemolyticus]
MICGSIGIACLTP